MTLIKPKIYVETTVISYLASKPSTQPLNLIRQQITQQWWKLAQQNYNLVISELVKQECQRGNEVAAQKRVEICETIKVLPITQQAITLANQLIQLKALPDTEPEDVIHIAIATLNKTDYMVSWNFSHMVSTAAKQKLNQTISQLMLQAPLIVTPEEMLEISHE